MYNIRYTLANIGCFVTSLIFCVVCVCACVLIHAFCPSYTRLHFSIIGFYVSAFDVYPAVFALAHARNDRGRGARAVGSGRPAGRCGIRIVRMRNVVKESGSGTYTQQRPLLQSCGEDFVCLFLCLDCGSRAEGGELKDKKLADMRSILKVSHQVFVLRHPVASTCAGR